MPEQPRFIFSATPNEGERTQLLRPRMLEEYVFSNVGLIMYGFFWLKFGLWLHSQGLDPDEQSELLLWTQFPDGEVDFKESLLYYSILMVYVADGTSNIPGKQITRGWLFAKQPTGTDQYDRTVEELETIVQDPGSLSGEQFTEAVIAPWFRTQCKEKDVDLPTRLEDRLDSALTKDYADDRRAMESAIEAFVTTIGEICHEYPSFYENYNTSPIDDPFDLTAILWETEAPARETLANRHVDLTERDVESLFEILKTFPRGIRMLHSFCFMAYIGPHDSGEDRMRDIYTICREQTTEVIDKAEKRFNQQFDPPVVEDIVATSFYYEVNYFLAESETITRKLLANRNGLIRIEDIERFLTDAVDDLPIARLESFVESPDSVNEYLPGLIERYDNDGDSDVEAFLTELQEEVMAGKTVAEVIAALLTQQGTFSEFDAENGIYQIEQPPETTSPATFYGVGSMLNYTAELLEATTHG